MKKIILLLSLLCVANQAISQNDSRVITTAVPFLLITSDARAGGMGEVGVATSTDAFSQQWNPSKYTFAKYKFGVGASYTPYLSELVNDIALLNLSVYNRFNDRSAWAASIKYFSLGDIELNDLIGNDVVSQGVERPNELTIDATYALRLSDNFSMAVTGRFLRSDLKIQSAGIDASAASSFAVDVSGFYQSQELDLNNFNGRWRGGFNISNIGPPIKYDEGGIESFIPTNLKLGGGFDFIFDEANKLALTLEVNKLLVPTPSVPVDNAGNEVSGEDDPNFSAYVQPDVSFFSGIFKSFGDAPDGFSEELKEFTWAFGAEYWYQDSFALRTGYFNESEEKGARKFFTLGAGFQFKSTTIDLSYLFSASKVRNPLENTLRFSLTFNFGDEFPDY